MADPTSTILRDQAMAIAASAREQVIAAVRVETERLRTVLDAVEPDVTSVVGQLCGTVRSDLIAALDKTAAAVRALAQATAGAQLLSTLVDVVAEHFTAVVVGAAGPHGFAVWHAKGFDPPLHPNTVLRGSPESPVVRATDTWRSVALDATSGILGTPVRYAIALPLVAHGHGTAMLYAETAPGAANDDGIATKIVEILIDTVRPRLELKPKAGAARAASGPGRQRQAQRMKMVDGTVVVIDEAECTLVDISTLGAQVLSPSVLRPNSIVRIVLPHEAGVAHAARVIWVVAEPHPSTQSALYRAGMQFTDRTLRDMEGYLDFLEFATKQ